MNRKFTDTERKLTEKNLKSQQRQLSELNEQMSINEIKQNFMNQQREYQDAVSEIEEKQSDDMFKKSIKMLKSQLNKSSDEADKLEIQTQIDYNTENSERLTQDRAFKKKWTPYLRDRTDKQNNEINEELLKDLKITMQIIYIAQDQLENGIEIKIPSGVN